MRFFEYESRATVAKAGGMIQADLECVCRLISLALRYRIPMHEITRQLIGIQDGNPYGMGGNRVLSLWDAIANPDSQALAFADLDGDNILDVIAPGTQTFAIAFSGRDGPS